MSSNSNKGLLGDYFQICFFRTLEVVIRFFLTDNGKRREAKRRVGGTRKGMSPLRTGRYQTGGKMDVVIFSDLS